jgi:glycosyltransferase 2 family protein
LVAWGYSLPDAVLVTLACRLVTLWLAVALGWAAVWALRRRSETVAVAPS